MDRVALWMPKVLKGERRGEETILHPIHAGIVGGFLLYDSIGWSVLDALEAGCARF